MAEPWLSIIGIGEDGLAGLSESSRATLDAAETVFGGPRHLALAGIGARGRPWPVPFDVAPVLALRGKPVAALASGDPFWFGAGAVLAARVDPAEMRAFPVPSVFSLAAARLGWKIEAVLCLGLHAAPFEQLVPVLHSNAQIICTLRDGAAAGDLARWLTDHGWGPSHFSVMEALGGPRERVRETQAQTYDLADISAPVAVAIVAQGGKGLPRASGLPDDLFAHDGQITNRGVRAMTLSALAPQPGEILWDLGAGSGSISVEWCLAGGIAVSWENRHDRAANIRANAERFGIAHRLTLHATDWGTLRDAPAPDAIFIGGGLTPVLFDALWPSLAAGIRVVVNAVTLETQGLVMGLQALYGGELTKIDLAHAQPIGRMRGWDAARTVVQWSAVK